MNTIRENSRFRIGWDLFVLVLIIASCLLIPFQIAFQHVTNWSGTEIVYLIDLFFLIDIVLNFFTSYRHKGAEITDRKKTAAHYLKTLFVIATPLSMKNMHQTLVQLNSTPANPLPKLLIIY